MFILKTRCQGFFHDTPSGAKPPKRKAIVTQMLLTFQWMDRENAFARNSLQRIFCTRQILVSFARWVIAKQRPCIYFNPVPQWLLSPLERRDFINRVQRHLPSDPSPRELQTSLIHGVYQQLNNNLVSVPYIGWVMWWNNSLLQRMVTASMETLECLQELKLYVNGIGISTVERRWKTNTSRYGNKNRAVKGMPIPGVHKRQC